MGLSTTHILLMLLVVVLLFGRGKVSELMGDVAKGIKSFKKGMAEDDVAAESAKGIEHARTPEAGRTDTTKTS